MTSQSATDTVNEARRRVTDALHAMHANQSIRIDAKLAADLEQAWTEYDAALTAGVAARQTKLEQALRAAVADIDTLRDWASDRAGRLRVHSFNLNAEEAEIVQRIVQHKEVVRALLEQSGTDSDEGTNG